MNVHIIASVILLAGAHGARYSRSPDLTGSLSAALGAQGRLMWIDGTANVFRTIKVNGTTTTVPYTTTREGVAEIVLHCKAAHINTLVVDVKPLSGQVLYDSKVAPRMTEWRKRPLPNFDVLKAFVEEGHKAGLQVDASINTLSEGHKYFGVGLAYQHPDWQSVVYTVNREMFAADGARLPVRAPGEPDDSSKPALLSDRHSILGGEPTSGMVGLESMEGESAMVEGRTGMAVGRQLNVALDANNRVTGILDSSLIGDEPLMAPVDGHLVTAVRTPDRAWIAQHVKAGEMVGFRLGYNRVPIAQAPSEKIACFVNPLNPEVRKHELDIVREIVGNYDIDGLVLDRCRFSNLYNDFSDLDRDAFARWLGRPIANWPEDVFRFSPRPGAKPIDGPLYKPWLEFRASVIRDFVAEIANIVRSGKRRIAFGTYVGSWYPSYYEVGVNWGSDRTNLRYPWFTADYPRTGYAEFFDWISTGCYYPTATMDDARRQGASGQGTVEFAAQLSNWAVASGAFVYPGVFVPDYENRPDDLLRALDVAGRKGQGWMVFDVSYVDEYNWWPILARASVKDAPPPDAITELLPAARSARDSAQ